MVVRWMVGPGQYGFDKEYQELEDAIVSICDSRYLIKNMKTKNPCKNCSDVCFYLPDSCEEIIYKSGERLNETEKIVENIIANDKNVKYLHQFEYSEFENAIFGIEWTCKNKQKWLIGE